MIDLRARLRANLLDRLIGYFAPERASKRLRARNRMDGMLKVRALYEGASSSHRASSWRPVPTDVNAEIRLAGTRLRDNARDTVRNTPYAERLVSAIAHNMIGTGIVCHAAGDPNLDPAVDGFTLAQSRERAAVVQRLMNRHLDSANIDADGRLNLYGLQELAVKTMVTSGEVLLRRRRRRPSDGLPLPFQIQILEPDFLDSSIAGPLANGNYAIDGIEFNLIGQRVAYYLFDTHPGQFIEQTNNRDWRAFRVPADSVAHLYRLDRPGQVRGVSWLAPVIVRLRDLADVKDATVMRQKIAACFAAFITGGEQDETGEFTPGGTPLEMLEPGTIERLREGESVTFAAPPPTNDYPAFEKNGLREVCAGVGIPYEAGTGDLEGVNYSSGRMGRLEFQRNIDSWRWNTVVPQLLDPVMAWTREAVETVTADVTPYVIRYTPPRREMIDPAVEIEASKQAIRNGLSSRAAEQRALGLDPEETDREFEESNARADELGLVFDSDPRRTNGRGAFQKGSSDDEQPGEREDGEEPGEELEEEPGDNGDNEGEEPERKAA